MVYMLPKTILFLLLNHNYIILPLLNYTNGADENSNLLELNFRCSKDINPGRDLCQKCSKHNFIYLRKPSNNSLNDMSTEYNKDVLATKNK